MTMGDEMRRLMGLDGDNSFERALNEGLAVHQKPRTGAGARPTSSLDEARGYAMMSLGDGSGSRSASRIAYHCIPVVKKALGEVCVATAKIARCVKKVRYNEPGMGDAAKAILDGPLEKIRSLAEAAGCALDEYFLSSISMTGQDDDCYWSMDLDADVMTLHGEVAEALAVGERLAKMIDGMSARDLPSVDLDAWKTAWTAFTKGAEGKSDDLEAACDKLMSALTKNG